MTDANDVSKEKLIADFKVVVIDDRPETDAYSSPRARRSPYAGHCEGQRKRVCR